MEFRCRWGGAALRFHGQGYRTILSPGGQSF